MINIRGEKYIYKVDRPLKNNPNVIAYQLNNKQKVIINKCSDTSLSQLEVYNTILSIRNPYINKIIDIIKTKDGNYLVSEYINGTSLKTILETRKLYHKLPESFFISLTIKTLEALNELHKHNILHLNIKPSNIYIKETYGLHPSQWNIENVTITGLEKSTKHPIIKETKSRFSLAYSPPEQLINNIHLINPSSDLYAVAIMLYEMIAGSPPFVDCEADMLLQLQLSHPISKRTTMRQEFYDIICRATQKPVSIKARDNTYNQDLGQSLAINIKQRYQYAEEMIIDLKQYLHLTKRNSKTSLWHQFLKRMGR